MLGIKTFNVNDIKHVFSIGCILINLMGWHLPTHSCGGALDLLMTAVPDLVQVTIEAPLGNLYQSSLSTSILMAHTVRNLCVSRKIFLKPVK